jgi:hypothetical protein
MTAHTMESHRSSCRARNVASPRTSKGTLHDLPPAADARVNNHSVCVQVDVVRAASRARTNNRQHAQLIRRR